MPTGGVLLPHNYAYLTIFLTQRSLLTSMKATTHLTLSSAWTIPNIHVTLMLVKWLRIKAVGTAIHHVYMQSKTTVIIVLPPDRMMK